MSQPIIEVKSKEKEKYMSAYVKGKEKFAYGFAGVGSYMVANIVSSYVNYYLTNIIMVTPVFILVLMIMGRVLDMCTDPMMGIIVDKTNTKKGKMRPYFQIGAFFIGIVTVFMFYPVGGSLVWRSIFAVVMYVGFGLAYTFVDVPAMGMLSVATPDKDERNPETPSAPTGSVTAAVNFRNRLYTISCTSGTAITCLCCRCLSPKSGYTLPYLR